MAKVWFVTGSSRGLGRAVVETALAAGQEVVATARDTTTLADLAAKYPDTVLPVRLDVTDPTAAEEAVHAAVTRFGRLDVVVNNAGYANLAPIEDVPMADFRAQVEAVFYGTVHVTKAALPVFLGQAAGHFIQVASIGGRLTAPGVGAYQSAKFATEGFSGVLNDEVKGRGVKVTIAEPGLMRTDWSGSSMQVAEVRPEYAETIGKMAEHLAAQRGQEPLDPTKVASVFLQLADMPNPPLHLVLGGAAVDMIAKQAAGQAAEDAHWAPLGRSVDYDPAPSS